NKNHDEVRHLAVFALRQWFGSKAENYQKLYDTLLKKQFSEQEATAIMHLLHGFTEVQLKEPATWSVLIEYLRHSKPAIRQLASWHLYGLLPDIGRTIPYSPVANSDLLQASYEKWKRAVPEGKLPPLPPPPGKGP